MTLKYNQGHWKWYVWVKLSEYYHHAKFDICHIYGDWENRNIKFLPHTDTGLASQPNTDHHTDSHFSVKSKAVSNFDSDSETPVTLKQGQCQ